MHFVALWSRRDDDSWSPGPIQPPDRATATVRYGLEKVLHDGAVTEISTLALELGMISGAAHGTDLCPRLAAAQHRITDIMEALREVGAMIYPPVLASSGLGPGLHSVAEARGLRLRLDLPKTELSIEAQSRTGLFVADHIHTLGPGSILRVRIRGRRFVRISMIDEPPGGGKRRGRRTVLRCA